MFSEREHAKFNRPHSSTVPEGVECRLSFCYELAKSRGRTGPILLLIAAPAAPPLHGEGGAEGGEGDAAGFARAAATTAAAARRRIPTPNLEGSGQASY